jgi:hypothetical protein
MPRCSTQNCAVRPDRWALRQLMAISLLHRSSGAITLEAGSAEEYARDHGFDMMLAILDGDECVKMLCKGDWVATAQRAIL